MDFARRARPSDRREIARVVEAAFGQDDEARLVERLEETGDDVLSLVAQRGESLTGHILFSPVSIVGFRSAQPALGLAPLAVDPGSQREGVGSLLAFAGLDACREWGAPLVVVLGHREYYPRFGFAPAHHFGLFYGARVANDSFMALELEPGALARAEGIVRYARAFSES